MLALANTNNNDVNFSMHRKMQVPQGSFQLYKIHIHVSVCFHLFLYSDSSIIAKGPFGVTV